MAKYHRLCGLNNINVFLTVLKAKKAKIRMPTDLFSGGSSVFRFADGYLFAVSPQSREGSSVSSSSYKSTSPTD